MFYSQDVTFEMDFADCSTLPKTFHRSETVARAQGQTQDMSTFCFSFKTKDLIDRLHLF